MGPVQIVAYHEADGGAARDSGSLRVKRALPHVALRELPILSNATAIEPIWDIVAFQGGRKKIAWTALH